MSLNYKFNWNKLNFQYEWPYGCKYSVRKFDRAPENTIRINSEPNQEKLVQKSFSIEVLLCFQAEREHKANIFTFFVEAFGECNGKLLAEVLRHRPHGEILRCIGLIALAVKSDRLKNTRLHFNSFKSQNSQDFIAKNKYMCRLIKFFK